MERGITGGKSIPQPPTRHAGARVAGGHGRYRAPVIPQRGFTLIEVVVALAVIALALSAVIQTTGGFIANQAYLRDRTLAHWVARNTLTEWQLSREWPGLGKQTGTAEFANHEWDWSVQVTQTDEEPMRRLDVEVRRVDTAGNALALLSGFIKKPK